MHLSVEAGKKGGRQAPPRRRSPPTRVIEIDHLFFPRNYRGGVKQPTLAARRH